MPTPNRKLKTPPPKATVVVTCPSCGRKGRTVNAKAPMRCSECGKEFKPGEGGLVRTIVLIVVALVAIAGIGYFAINRAQRIDAEEKAKAAIEARQQPPPPVRGN